MFTHLVTMAFFISQYDTHLFTCIAYVEKYHQSTRDPSQPVSLKNGLSLPLQDLLLSSNFPVIAHFGETFYDNPELNGRFAQSIADTLLKKRLDFVTDRMAELNVTRDVQQPSNLFETFSRQQVADFPEETGRFAHIKATMQRWHTPSPAHPDAVMLMLMSLMMVFSAEGLALDDGRAADDAQAKYAYLLRKHLKAKFGCGSAANKKFHEALFMRTLAKEAFRVRRTVHLNSMCQ